VSKQLGIPRVVLSSMKLVSYELPHCSTVLELGRYCCGRVCLVAFPRDRRVPTGAASVHRSQGGSRTVSGCRSHRSAHISALAYCHEAKENVTPTHFAGCNMKGKKCIQNSGEEN
jgi:hypothetical protein